MEQGSSPVEQARLQTFKKHCSPFGHQQNRARFDRQESESGSVHEKNCVVGGNRVDEMNDFSALGPIPQNLALGLKRRAMDFPYPSA